MRQPVGYRMTLIAADYMDCYANLAVDLRGECITEQAADVIRINRQGADWRRGRDHSVEGLYRPRRVEDRALSLSVAAL